MTDRAETCPHRAECWLAFLNWWDGEPPPPETCWRETEGRVSDCEYMETFRMAAAGEPVQYYAIEVM